MLGLGFHRETRVLFGALAVVISVAVVVPAALGAASSSSALDKLAARLRRLDPGKRVGGDTQVGTAPGQRLVGRPGRANFIIALGPHEVIVGGAGHDELGALGDAAKIYGGAGPDLIHGGPGGDILDGGPGNDLIYGGAGNDVIKGGPGNDRIYGGPGNDVINGGPGNDVIYGGAGNDVINGGPGNDVIYGNKRAHTTVFPGSGTNQVNVANGHGGDRVMCAPGSINHITADRGDRVAPSCRGKRSSTVRYVRLQSGRPAAHAAQVGGIGTNGDPYTAECDDPKDVECTVTFPARTLTGLWANEYVPAYECPQGDHPYLLQQNYAPGGTSLIDGVAVTGLGPIGVSITGASGDPYATGTLTGYPWSSATNWTFGTNSYHVVLHCTSDADGGYTPSNGGL